MPATPRLVDATRLPSAPLFWAELSAAAPRPRLALRPVEAEPSRELRAPRRLTAGVELPKVALPAPSDPASKSVDVGVLRSAMDVISSEYLDAELGELVPIEPRYLALGAVTALLEADPALSLRFTWRTLELLHAGRSVAALDAPGKHDAAGWARVAVALIEDARARSPKLGALDVSAIHTTLLTRMVAPLDRYTRYQAPVPGNATTGAAGAAAADAASPNVLATRLGDYAHLTVKSFATGTGKHFEAALRPLVEQGARGLILDLRGNRGGYVSEFAEVADALLERGLIGRLIGRKSDSVDVYMAQRGDILRGLPVVVLTDEDSASSSELLAGALQQRGRAVVVGHGTYRKGVAQIERRLPNGGAVYLTVQRFYGPLDIPVHGIGVTPSVCLAGASSAEAVIDALRAGKLAPPATLGASQRIAEFSEKHRDVVRAGCAQGSSSSALGLEVAQRLLADPALYATTRDAMTRNLAQPARKR